MNLDDRILTRLENRDQFIEIIREDFYDTSCEMGVQPHFNKAMALDAYFQWMQDIQRIRSFEEKVTEPDHIKKTAHLIYWLRRFSPVNDFVVGGENVAEVDNGTIEFMLLYGREYLAFNLGYRIAKLYECSISNRNLDANSFSLQSSFDDVPSHDYLKTIVHIMKTKMISPQSFVVALKGLFLRP